MSSGARDEKSCVSSVLQKRHGGMMVDHVLIDRAPGQDRARGISYGGMCFGIVVGICLGSTFCFVGGQNNCLLGDFFGR